MNFATNDQPYPYIDIDVKKKEIYSFFMKEIQG